MYKKREIYTATFGPRYFITNCCMTGEEVGKEVNKDSFLSTRQSHPSDFLVKIRNFNGK